MIKKFAAPLAALLAAGLVLSGCSASNDEPAGPSTGGGLDELIATAQDEGFVTFYLTQPESVGQALADAFADEYGIEASFVRLTGGELSTRYSAEAESGTVVADVVMPSYESFVDSAMDEGWLLPADESDIPDYDSYPEEGKIDGGRVAITTFTPSGLSWNTDALGDIPAPESFEDLADPAYAGKVLLTDPSTSQSYLDFWTLMLDSYGEETVRAIVDNSVRYFPSVVPMTESLAAGEGAVTGPNVGVVVQGAIANGAPLDFGFPDVTTGPEIVIAVSADAPSPNAARLFAHFVLSEAGQAIVAGAPGSISPYDADQLPAGYERVDRAAALENEQLIYDIFGL